MHGLRSAPDQPFHSQSGNVLRASVRPPISAQPSPSHSFARSWEAAEWSLSEAPREAPGKASAEAPPSLSDRLSQTSGVNFGLNDRESQSQRLADTARSRTPTAQDEPFEHHLGEPGISLSEEMRKNFTSEAPSRPGRAGSDVPTDKVSGEQSQEPREALLPESTEPNHGTSESSRVPSSPDASGPADSHLSTDEWMRAVGGPSHASPAKPAVTTQLSIHSQDGGPVTSWKSGDDSRMQGAPVVRSGGETAGNGSHNQTGTGTTTADQSVPLTLAKAGGIAMNRAFVDHLGTMRPQGPSPQTGPPVPGSTQSPATAHGLEDEVRGATFRPQVLRGMLTSLHGGGGSVTMRLEPESLGALRVQMTMTSRGEVSVQFHVSTEEARQLLTQSMDSLRSAMEQNGLKFDQVTIQSLSRSSQGGESQTNQDSGTGRQQGQFTQADRDAAGHESRGNRGGDGRHEGRPRPAPSSTSSPEAGRFQVRHKGA